MSEHRTPSGLLNFDILALSLLCCLLAAVVALIVAQGHRDAEAELIAAPSQPLAAAAPPRQPVLDWDRLTEAVSGLDAGAGAAARLADAVSARLTRSTAERENAVLASRLAALGEKVALMQRFAAANAEARRLEQQLEARRKRASASSGRGARRLLGDYRGPYVLIECTEGAVTVYPGKQRLDIRSAKARLDELVAKIDAAGFVAFVVRPGGWYRDSFDALRPRIYEALAQIQRQTGRTIGRNMLPLEASEPIADYLPPGGPT